MPVYVDELSRNTAKVTFPVGDGEVTVVYRPALITEEMFAQMLAFGQIKTNQEALKVIGDMNKMIVLLVDSWDIYTKAPKEGEEPETWPIDEQALVKLPLALRLTVIMNIANDFRPELPGASSTPTSSS